MRWPNEFAWTEERVEQLIALRQQGKPFSEIGEILGATKNSCIGKFNRLSAERAAQGKPIEVPDAAKSNLNGRIFKTSWTPKAIEFLVEHRAQGQSFVWIGWRLGRSAKACARKFALVDAARTAAGAPIVIAKPAKPTRAPTAPQPRYKPRPEPVATIAIPETNRVTLDELRAHHCRWVIGEPNGFETLFCGNPVERRSLCAGHVEIGFYTPKKTGKTFKLQDLSAK
jgi:hypothetical protein